MKVSKTFLETLINMAHCAETDKVYRNNLAHCRVKVIGEQLEFTTCDGHKLARRFIPLSENLEGTDKTEFAFEVTKEKLGLYKALLKTLGKYSTGAVLDFDGHEGERVKFPDFEAVIPKGDGYESLSVSFNAEYLMELLKAMREDSKKTQVVLSFKAVIDYGHINSLDKMAPILVKVSGNNGVLMPMKS